MTIVLLFTTTAPYNEHELRNSSISPLNINTNRRLIILIARIQQRKIVVHLVLSRQNRAADNNDNEYGEEPDKPQSDYYLDAKCHCHVLKTNIRKRIMENLLIAFSNYCCRIADELT